MMRQWGLLILQTPTPWRSVSENSLGDWERSTAYDGGGNQGVVNGIVWKPQEKPFWKIRGERGSGAIRP